MKKTINILLALLFVTASNLKATTSTPTTQTTSNTKQPTEQWVWHNPMAEAVPPLHGRAWNNEIGATSFSRLPERMKPTLPPAVYRLSKQSAGISLVFKHYERTKRIGR